MRAYLFSAIALGVVSLIACATDGQPRSGFVGEPAPEDGKDNKPIAPPLPNTPPPCTGLGCAVPDCPPGSPTIIEGDVYDPAAKTKLYNVLAWVPQGDLPPLEKGASCDQCGKLSGKAVTTALSDEHGHFRLENTPAGDDVPVVLQVGKFRRKITVPHVEKCTTNTITDKAARLPRNQQEGDLPKVAAITGAFDELYCLLLRVGIDATEHTTPDKSGAVHVYRGQGGPDHLNGGAPAATTLWDDVEKLAKYDIILLGCEGEDFDDAARGNKTPAAKEAMRQFAERGGRIFATHYQSAWFRNNPEADFKGVATWRGGNSAMSAYGSNIPLKIDSTFPKGQAFASWMKEVNATDAGAAGNVLANNVGAGIEAVNPAMATRWLYREDSRPGVTFMSFNAPVGAATEKQCGRAVISDLHFGDELSTAKPPQCGGAITPAGLALEFLLFDLSSCIQPDTEIPKAPK
jgi:hypothetical protein